jgi:hypothetical protein
MGNKNGALCTWNKLRKKIIPKLCIWLTQVERCYIASFGERKFPHCFVEKEKRKDKNSKTSKADKFIAIEISTKTP